MRVLIIVLVMGILSGPAFAAHRMEEGGLTEDKAVLAIIGEGEGESYAGKLALAYAIINRGNLKGVYGLTSERVKNHLYSDDVRDQALSAWRYAFKHPENDNTNGATGWVTVKYAKAHKHLCGWFGRCTKAARVGNHVFYTEGKQ